MQNEAPRPELIYPPELEIWPFPADCPNRVLIEEIADKWTILVVAALSRGPARFNQLKRALDPVTQKSLTQTLRRLERSGMVSRTVLDTSPVAVEYGITPSVGRSRGRFPLYTGGLSHTKTGLKGPDSGSTRREETLANNKIVACAESNRCAKPDALPSASEIACLPIDSWIRQESIRSLVPHFHVPRSRAGLPVWQSPEPR